MEFAEKEACLTTGLFSFLVGHIFYIICFIQQINHHIPLWLYISLIAYFAYGVVFYRSLNIQNTKLKAAAAVYCGVLLLMSFTALFRVQSVSSFKFLLTFIGTTLFIASDSILAFNMFNKKLRYSGLWIMSTYGMAQLLIIAGL